jgi:hypothetical protein
MAKSVFKVVMQGAKVYIFLQREEAPIAECVGLT